VKFSAPRIPVVFNVDAEEESDPEKIKSKLQEQLVKPVLWDRSMTNAVRNYNLAHVVEVGPGWNREKKKNIFCCLILHFFCELGNILTGIMRRILKASDAPSKPRPSAISV
jgi:hypothetical protein